MTITISLPPQLESTLRQEAASKAISLSDFIVSILNSYKQPDEETLEELVTRIQSLPVDPALFAPPKRPLAELLTSSS